MAGIPPVREGQQLVQIFNARDNLTREHVAALRVMIPTIFTADNPLNAHSAVVHEEVRDEDIDVARVFLQDLDTSGQLVEHYLGLDTWDNGVDPNLVRFANDQIVDAFLNDSRNLNLVGCGLNSLPEGIGKLIHLQTLDVSFNRLDGLPNSLGNMTNLRVLDCSHNGLWAFPSQINVLRNLERLDVSHNKIGTPAKQMSIQQSLRFIDISHNNIDDTRLSVRQLRGGRVWVNVGNPALGHANEELGVPEEII